MSAEPEPVAGQTALSLEVEPLVFFHSTVAGLAPAGKVQPVPGTLPLEEEPAIWLEVDGVELISG
jgi:hypothetical protein